MNIKRKLAEGVAGWLLHEFHCFRGDLFSEKALAIPIGQILAGCFGRRIRAEVEHPVLASHMTGAGRRPQLDFAISDKEKITLAVESKWAGHGVVDVGDILWDVIRLELVSNKSGADCYFVLAGRMKILKKIFASSAFLDKRPSGRTRPILRVTKQKKAGVRLDSPSKSRLDIIRPYFAKYPNVSMPSRISTGLPSVYPAVGNSMTFQVYVWRISTAKDRDGFLPSEHSLYEKT